MKSKQKVKKTTKKSTKKSTLVSRFQVKPVTVLLFALLFGGIGAILLLTTRAEEIPSATVSGGDRFGMASGELAWLGATDINNRLDGYKAVGSKWVRFDYNWGYIQRGGPTSYDWTATDNIVKGANARGMKVLGMIGYTPSWARPSNCMDNDKCAPTDPTAYAKFSAEVAKRYGPMGVHHWEIWNEPNIIQFWKPAPNATQYAQMLKASSAAIKQVDPSAIVISAGTAPGGDDTATQIDPRIFLKTLYDNGAGPYFDAVGHHPYCFYPGFNCPTQVATWSNWSRMSQTTPSLRSVMADHGDSHKKIWATEFGAPTNGHDSITEAAQAQMVTDAYKTFASYDWAGPLFWYTYKDYGNGTDTSDRENWFGLVRVDGTKKPSYSAFLQAVTAAGGTSTTPPPTITPAKVTLSGIGAGQTVNGAITVQAVPSNASNITKVDFYLDNNLLQSENSSPYCMAGNTTATCDPYDTKQLSNATHILRAVMAYNGGANTTEAIVSFTVSNATPPPASDITAPAVTINSPAPNVSLGSKTIVRATATDAVGVTKMEIYVDGILRAVSGTGATSYSWNTRKVTKGAHTITVNAYDAAGNKATQSITVYR